MVDEEEWEEGKLKDGLTVPGVYGPAKEEWAAAGMEAPKM